MVREIVKDELFLRQKSTEAVRADMQIVTDLQDTLREHRAECVGMAANMIGYRKRIIIVSVGPFDMVMINPKITARSGRYEASEGCLSLSGVRTAVRYQKIRVSYTDVNWKQQSGAFEGRTAQIIQHECDHLEGILI